MADDAAGSPSTARDRAIEQWRISPVTSLVVGWMLPAVGELMRQLHAADLDAQEAGVPTEQADVPAGGSTPDAEDERLDDVQSWLHEQNEATDGPMYARTLGLVQDQAAEVERLRWERDMALSRVAAAEAVQCRMGDSLPDSGPWESWSERDRAVRDYEGDLSAALATEDDTVGERLREAERERDEARQERDDKVVELTITRAVLAQQTRKRDEARAAVRGLVDNYTAHDQQAFEAAHEAAIAVLAGGSAPHQGATTDVTAP